MNKQQSAISRGMFSPERAAREIGVCPKTILRWCKAGKLTAYHFARNVVRIKPSDLEAFMERAQV